MQLTLSLNPDITQQFRSLRAVIAASVYDSRGGLSATAADCDMSPSELSKQLSGSEQRKFDVDDFERALASSRDLRPIYYLVAKFMQDDETKRRVAVAELSNLLPRIEQLLAVTQPQGKGRR